MKSEYFSLNKWRLLLVLLLAVLFIMNGLTILFEGNSEAVKTNLFLVKIIGGLSVVFFGLIVYTTSKQLFDTTLGIYINEDGILDSSNSMAVGQINWANIIEIETVKTLWMKSLAIHTNNPEKYLQHVSGIKLRVLAGNLNRTKTPVVLSARNLKISHAKLEETIRDYWQLSKEK